MTVIRKKIVFKVSNSSKLKENTIEYFKRSGFKYNENNSIETKIIFERGSIASNMWTFNPLNWKSIIDIEINGDEVEANFIINPTGQIPTNEDQALWETFIENYEKYIRDIHFGFLNENIKSIKTIKSKNLEYIGWAVLGGIIGGIPSALIGYWTGINAFVYIGTASGAIALLINKINKKKKNAL